ncbi:lipid A-modifier LpxR family protein [Pseudophaeobacter sp.]|uniref:lipid A-modifier LpxR family protein n=1 Tax=Pseudophaeobacter sp. TaxID=1971739 RepID=UPI0032973DCD
MYRQLVAMAFSLFLPFQASAESPAPEGARHKIGYGLMFTNDLLGDGKDRWRTGSLTSSRIYGRDWQGQAPAGFGELLELRIQGQIIAPADLVAPDPTDRPWAGALTVELNSHMQRRGTEISLGAGLAILGPQTQLDEMQGWLHDLAGAPQPSAAVLNGQVANRVRPLISAEVGREFALSDRAALRPFVEARAGDETYLRAGVDFTYGQLSQGLLARDSVSGQRYRTMMGEATGLTLTAGADIAYVSNSVFLPDAAGYSLENNRHRARLGLRWQGQNLSAFYGLSYLGKEFSSQSEGQLTGALQVQLRF